MEKYICLHGHFYQPPRENAWLEEVELQDSAHPYHDWNERIKAECYAPNTASRILDTDGRITDIVNNYSKISFDYGPTLLSWMERHSPETYQAIIEADRQSMENFSGHGSAMAQAYSHMIMPLANRRDKYTQVLWGIRDFEYRFKRFPEGMWLPETAVDVETLDILAELGISFTVLAPRQARRARKSGRGSRWQNVSEGKIDPTTAYLCRLPSGRNINLFFYDGPISQDVAFSGLLGNGEEFARRLTGAFFDKRSWPQIVHIATDGETYGHHHRGGDMALAYCLHYIESKKLAKLTNYGEYLEKHPPAYEVEIFENSSWSCIHGIERWRDNCGCHTGTREGWTQEWRKPLREALDELRYAAIPMFEEGLRDLLKNPWQARDDYISVILDRDEENVKRFFLRNAAKKLTREEKTRALKYLEMQRHAMLMYTSCGWFFDEVSGIETVQIMQYAAKVIQFALELKGASLEADFVDALANAPSNVYGNAAKPYEMFVKPSSVDLLRVGAHYVISSVFHEYPQTAAIFCYSVKTEEYNVWKKEKQKLAAGKLRIISNITLEEKSLIFAVLHLGYQNIFAGVKEFDGDKPYIAMQQDLQKTFEGGDFSSVETLIYKHFGERIFSLSHLFRDEQRKIMQQILDLAYEGIDASCRQIYENYYAIMDLFPSLNMKVPAAFSAAAGHIINRDLKKIFEEGDIKIEKLEKLIPEIKKWSVELDAATVGYVAGSRINSLMEELAQRPEDAVLIDRTENILKLTRMLPVELDLWKAQNIYFSINKKLYKAMKDEASKGENASQKWVHSFRKLGHHLHVKVS
ncbi:MAG: DUF3536 domain-containing protein [Nitrospirae bacterium]|nr:DUF3536 domain-containing protein [Nitrospirota bacterium]